MTNPLAILHLSDLQFGKNHRYPDGAGSFDCLFAKLAEDLDVLAAEADLRPSVMVITGDVAEWSLPAEYAAAQEFLEKLTAKLALPRQQVVIVPGVSRCEPITVRGRSADGRRVRRAVRGTVLCQVRQLPAVLQPVL